MFKLKFGNITQTFDQPVSVYDAASALSLTSRDTLACEIDGKVCDLSTILSHDASVQLLTFAHESGKRVFWHTSAHILAQAVKRLYPDVKLGIGPAVDNGFYYDFESDVSFTPEVLRSLESEMKKIVHERLVLRRFTLPRAEAIALMEQRGEPLKVQLIRELPQEEEISFYQQGEYIDLCAGPHLYSTAAVKAFKLTSCTGAYWKGDQNNQQMQRIYGTSFPTKDELRIHFEQMEEAKKRDHNKIGRELE